MIKIELKTIFRNVIFEHSSENNTIKETLTKAVTERANLSEANLRGAELIGKIKTI